MQFGMHIRWLLSVEQTRINPFTCNPAKLPCRQALHFKCTISYPCLVWMQHFWDIRPGGNARRMAAATPYIVPPCCLELFVVSVVVFPFILIFSPFSLFLIHPEMNCKCESSLWGGRDGGWGASAVVSLWRLHSLQYVFWQEHKHAPWASWSGLREWMG